MNKALKAFIIIAVLGAVGFGAFALVKKYVTSEPEVVDDTNEDSVIPRYTNSLEIKDDLFVVWNASNFATYDVDIEASHITATIVSNSVANFTADVGFLNNSNAYYNLEDYVSLNTSITKGVGKVTFIVDISFKRDNFLIPTDLSIYFVSSQIPIRPGIKILKTDNLVDSLIF